MLLSKLNSVLRIDTSAKKHRDPEPSQRLLNSVRPSGGVIFHPPSNRGLGVGVSKRIRLVCFSPASSAVKKFEVFAVRVGPVEWIKLFATNGFVLLVPMREFALPCLLFVANETLYLK